MAKMQHGQIRANGLLIISPLRAGIARHADARAKTAYGQFRRSTRTHIWCVVANPWYGHVDRVFLSMSLGAMMLVLICAMLMCSFSVVSSNNVPDPR